MGPCLPAPFAAPCPAPLLMGPSPPLAWPGGWREGWAALLALLCGAWGRQAGNPEAQSGLALFIRKQRRNLTGQVCLLQGLGLGQAPSGSWD